MRRPRITARRAQGSAPTPWPLHRPLVSPLLWPRRLQTRASDSSLPPSHPACTSTKPMRQGKCLSLTPYTAERGCVARSKTTPLCVLPCMWAQRDNRRVPGRSDVDCESKQDKSAHCYIFAVDQTPLNALSSTNLPEPQLPRVFGKCGVRPSQTQPLPCVLAARARFAASCESASVFPRNFPASSANAVRALPNRKPLRLFGPPLCAVPKHKRPQTQTLPCVRPRSVRRSKTGTPFLGSPRSRCVASCLMFPGLLPHNVSPPFQPPKP